MEKSAPITEFENPEVILELQELVGFEAVMEIVFTLFSDGDRGKPGCMINAEWFQRQCDDIHECKQNLSEVLETEHIPHIFHDSDESSMVFIGDTDILQSQNYGFLTRFSKECTTQEDMIRFGRFLGVPDEDNMFIEDSNRDIGGPQTVDEVEISDTERFYLRLLSWQTAPTRDGIRRGVAAGRERFNAFETAIDTHPNYSTELKVAFHSKFAGAGVFYGHLSRNPSQKLYQQFYQANKKLDNSINSHADNISTHKY